MDFSKPIRNKVEVNPIPMFFVNIIFLLILFFMISGTLSKDDVIPIHAPVSQSGTTLLESPVEILVGEDLLILDLEIVSEKTLFNSLQKIILEHPDREIQLKADANLDAKRLIDVLKIVRRTGARNLYLVTMAPF